MPVHHLGLTVSHIPSATSFYLQTLQPLGYHFIAQSGDSIGLGVTTADLFLTQEPKGASVSPTHIAFAADSRLAVRNCYAAALSAGAYPSGAPSYRNPDGTVFSAAVEDLDGNVVEIVYREGIDFEPAEGVAAPSKDGRVIAWQKDVADSGLHDDAESVASKTSHAKSRAQTAMDLASTASKSIKSGNDESTPNRAASMPASTEGSSFPTKALFGTILGAAAGAALIFAVKRSEGENAKEEADFEASKKAPSSRGKPATVSTVYDPRDDKSQHRNFSTTESRVSKPPKSHRNFSVTDSAYSKPQMPTPPRTMRAIDQAGFYDDDEVRDAISRFASSRRPPAPRRAHTTDAMDLATVSRGSRSLAPPGTSTSQASSRRHLHSGKSRHYDQRSEKASEKASEKGYLPSAREQLLLEAPPAKSTASRSRFTRFEDEPENDDDQDLKRRDSGISFGSLRSHHSKHADERTQVSQRTESTAKPLKRGTSNYESAANIPLPDSKAPSEYRSRYSDFDDGRSRASRRSESTVRPSRKGTSHHDSAADVPLPESKAPSEYRSRYTDAGDQRSHVTRRSESRAPTEHRSHASRRAESKAPTEHRSQTSRRAESRAPTEHRSHASRRSESKGPAEHRSHASRRSESTVRGSRKGTSHHNSAADVALPESTAPSDHRSRHTGPPDQRSNASKRSESTVRASRKGTSHHESAAGVPLPESKANSHFSEGHRSRHTAADGQNSHHSSRHERHESPHRSNREREVEVTYSGSKAPSHVSHRSAKKSHHDSAADVALPASKAPSHYSKHGGSSHYKSAHEVPLPVSQPQSHVSARDVPMPASNPASYVSARDVPMPASNPASYVSARDIPVPSSHGAGWEDAEVMQEIMAEDFDDNMADMKTVVPDDSISCIDYSKPARSNTGPSFKSAASRREEREARRSEAAGSDRTVRALKKEDKKRDESDRFSAATLPAKGREKKEGKRSVFSFH
ncbi:hypothetical protein D0863_06435 [Hortaea werneckii]|uniref:VOC domain-containing protein n=1 Tax=Hortaea werneckii TaxID=91943 RepID=A0A3M7DYI1_HORWE|nr:hypothetical protein D0863_06435 [Hortaea werneckii]